MDLANILDDCLQQLKAGGSVSQCLARYPDRAAELAPMLQAALRVQLLAEQRLSDGQRLRATVAMREALASRPARTSWLGGLRGAPHVRGLVATGAVILLLLIVVSTSVVAASRPGDPAYALRTILERAPVLIQPTAAGRATAELRAADRRLADLESHLTASGEVDAVALNALVQGHRAAAMNAGELPEASRLQIAIRMEIHAQIMTRLANQELEPQARQRVRAAAQESNAIAQRLRAGQPAPTETPPAGPQGPRNGEPRPGGVVVTPPPRRPARVSPTAVQATPEPTTAVSEPGATRTQAPGRATQVPGRTPQTTPTDLRPGRGTPPATRGPSPGGPEDAPAATATALPEPTPTETVVPPPMPDQTPPGPQGTRPPDPERTPPGPGNGQPQQPSRTPGPRS